MAHIDDVSTDLGIARIQSRYATEMRDHALQLLRAAAAADDDLHFDDHLIEFAGDGRWTVQHPIAERIHGTLFGCRAGLVGSDHHGYAGRFVLVQTDDGKFHVGSPVER